MLEGLSVTVSATEMYVAHTSGWTLHKRSGGTDRRKVVTTRRDGVVVVEFGHDWSGDRFIKVTVD
jgi:hypothetical protein